MEQPKASLASRLLQGMLVSKLQNQKPQATGSNWACDFLCCTRTLCDGEDQISPQKSDNLVEAFGSGLCRHDRFLVLHRCPETPASCFGYV